MTEIAHDCEHFDARDGEAIEVRRPVQSRWSGKVRAVLLGHRFSHRRDATKPYFKSARTCRHFLQNHHPLLHCRCSYLSDLPELPQSHLLTVATMVYITSNTANIVHPIDSATGPIYPVPLPPLSIPRPVLPRASFSRILDGDWEVPVEAPRVRVDQRHIQHRLLLAREFDLKPDPQLQMLIAAAKTAVDMEQRVVQCPPEHHTTALVHYELWALAIGPQGAPPTPEPQPAPQSRLEASVSTMCRGYASFDTSRLPRPTRTSATSQRRRFPEGTTAADLLRAMMASDPEPSIPYHRGRFSSKAAGNLGGRRVPNYACVAAY